MSRPSRTPSVYKTFGDRNSFTSVPGPPDQHGPRRRDRGCLDRGVGGSRLGGGSSWPKKTGWSSHAFRCGRTAAAAANSRQPRSSDRKVARVQLRLPDALARPRVETGPPASRIAPPSHRMAFAPSSSLALRRTDPRSSLTICTEAWRDGIHPGREMRASGWIGAAKTVARGGVPYQRLRSGPYSSSQLAGLATNSPSASRDDDLDYRDGRERARPQQLAA